ncbi:Uncharacterized protein YktA, UPF0223 family [Salinibacillus kushneri]|uniref:UPF0223 protein SAMN05421676_109144 n=1 Tax=Salinibacillus kushneri TaxID=237682 RepID=A0A1I0HRH7_9BACI|nr:UPF0223 family protein [Salinibacillus kushneri]SET86624.1 Uncharacterized protein YktA, UPF0223 family [Salinibacillus kushneri]
MEYHYPIDESWDTDEVMDVIHFLQLIEKAYEDKANRDDLLHAYHRFKEIVPSKMEEKQIDKKFNQQSGYSTYRTIQKAKQAENGETITMAYK